MKWLVCLAAAATLAAQDPQFGVQSRLVLVPVTVTDAKGRPVDGLEPGDFAIFDNGRPQKATVDIGVTGVAPIALIVAIQASGISKAVLEKVRKVGAMIQPLVTGDRGCAAVVQFADRIVWLQDCTNSDDALSRAFERVRPGAAKTARMLDAVHESIKRLQQRPTSRRVLLLISESRDRGSETALEEVAVAAQAAGVTIYAATYSAFLTAWTTKSSATGEPTTPKRPNRPSEQTGTVTGVPHGCGNGCSDPTLPPPEQRVDILGAIRELGRSNKTKTTQVLTEQTGGVAFPFTRLKGLEQAIANLGEELHSQYLLSFTPADPAPGYHRLEVRVAGEDYRVRARPGYWSIGR